MLQPSASIGVEPDLLIGVLDELFSQRALLQFDPDYNGRPFQLWRLMIAADHQGYGRAAVLLGVEGCQRRNATPTVTTWPPTQGAPPSHRRPTRPSARTHHEAVFRQPVVDHSELDRTSPERSYDPAGS